MTPTPAEQPTATPAKQWSLQIISPDSGPLQVLREGAPLDLNHIEPGQVTPVELLLASIASCFALSCHAAFTLRQQQRTALEVEVTGSKAPQLPSRLAEVRLDVRFVGLPEQEARAISALAKRMCTVTNTLAAVPPSTLEVNVLQGW
jgi:uncharacterized OsmC-like protein